MTRQIPQTISVLPNPSIFRGMLFAQRFCLALSGLATVDALWMWLRLGSSKLAHPGASFTAPLVLTVVVCFSSLLLSEPESAAHLLVYFRRFVNSLALISAAVLLFHVLPAASGVGGASQSAVQGMPIARLLIVTLALLAIVVVLIQSTGHVISRFADILGCCLCILVLTLVAEHAFNTFPIFGGPNTVPASTVILICLTLLSLVAVLRHAEHGVFAIFMGVGVSSKLARIFVPFLLALPFFREAFVASLTKAGAVPGPYIDAVIASIGATILLGILLFFTWHISDMENEINDLILRDDVTRLYNFRGFHMLAEHALRLAQRSNLPFSVLFIDLKNVSKINSELGPDAAASYIAQAGELLRRTFRESDIKGRIGRDEFAIAGQVDRTGITVAALRLEAASAAHRTEEGMGLSLEFNIGHITSEENSHESLKELMARADKSRFPQKQLKDLPVN
jgi:diguanylate cyclase (GGDEF)-like protein